MPQARLPDINTSFNFYRGKAITHLQGKNYTGAIGSLYAFNNDLQKNYQVKISTKEYNEKISFDKEAVCTGCNERVVWDNVITYTLLNNSSIVMLTGQKLDTVWDCLKCKKVNKVSKTQFKQKVLAKPYRLKIVPEPPEQNHGLIDSLTFDRKFQVWFWQFLDELEGAAAQFRDDNWQKEDEQGNQDDDINTEDDDFTE